MKTVSIGYLREDGDFAILATLNNNDDHYSEEGFDNLVKGVLKQMESLLEVKILSNDYGDELLVLNRQDTPDYVDTLLI